MPGSRILISSTTLTTSAASVTFSSIPATYTDLVLKMSMRADTAAGFERLQIRFNGDTATNYSTIDVYSTPGQVLSETNANKTYFYIQQAINSTAQTANTFANAELYIPSYQASQNKPAGFFGVAENNSASLNAAFININSDLWRNTSAITSLNASIGSGNFVSGSSFYLYGIKNS